MKVSLVNSSVSGRVELLKKLRKVWRHSIFNEASVCVGVGVGVYPITHQAWPKATPRFSERQNLKRSKRWQRLGHNRRTHIAVTTGAHTSQSQQAHTSHLPELVVWYLLEVHLLDRRLVVHTGILHDQAASRGSVKPQKSLLWDVMVPGSWDDSNHPQIEGLVRTAGDRHIDLSDMLNF